MRHNEFPTHREPVDDSHGFELRDIVLSVIIRWVLFLFVFMAFSAALAYGAYLVFIPRNTTLATDSPLRPQRIEPPKPRLQAYPKSEMRDFRADEDTKVNDYAWLDKNKGVARIPVDAALKLMAKNGLPTQQTNSSSVGPAYDTISHGRPWSVPQPVGTDSGYKPPVVYRKYPY